MERHKRGILLMSQRERHLALIKAAEEEMKTAGPIHKKDLRRYIIRMKRELRQYDRWQAEAKH